MFLNLKNSFRKKVLSVGHDFLETSANNFYNVLICSLNILNRVTNTSLKTCSIGKHGKLTAINEHHFLTFDFIDSVTQLDIFT